MRILKWVTDNGLEAVFMIPFIAITILCSCGGKEDRTIVIKNSHGQSTVIFSADMGRTSQEKAIAWIEDNTDKKIVSVSFDWHGAMSVIVYEVGDPKKPSKCKECGQPKLCEEPKP